jgi:hypothetical protein
MKRTKRSQQWAVSLSLVVLWMVERNAVSETRLFWIDYYTSWTLASFTMAGLNTPLVAAIEFAGCLASMRKWDLWVIVCLVAYLWAWLLGQWWKEGRKGAMIFCEKILCDGQSFRMTSSLETYSCQKQRICDQHDGRKKNNSERDRLTKSKIDLYSHETGSTLLLTFPKSYTFFLTFYS